MQCSGENLSSLESNLSLLLAINLFISFADELMPVILSLLHDAAEPQRSIA